MKEKQRKSKPRATGPSVATTAILVILCAIIVCYALYQVIGNARTPYAFYTTYSYQTDDETTVSGYVIRDESPLDNSSGVLDISCAEGERVAVGQTVATVYSSDDALAAENQLDLLRAQLTQLQYALGETVGSTAGARLDSSIQDGLFALRENLRDGQFSTMEDTISALSARIVKRDYSSSDNSGDLAAQITELQSQISALQAQQAQSSTRISVSSSGLYSAVVDGYETVLTPASVDTMTPSQLAGIQSDSACVSNVGKLIYGSTWYYAANMDETTAASYKVGTTVTLRFVKDLNRSLTMTVYRVSDTEDGQKLVVFSSSSYLSEVTLLRHQTANIIHESYTGIRIPTESLRMEEGVAGVYCIVGEQALFKPVEILYQGDDYYLVVPAQKSDGTENTGSSALRSGDRVIVTAQELYNGKVVD